jgi:hypothetical protein
VNRAINLYTKSALFTIKIKNVLLNWLLSPKLKSL